MRHAGIYGVLVGVSMVALAGWLMLGHVSQAQLDGQPIKCICSCDAGEAILQITQLEPIEVGEDAGE